MKQTPYQKAVGKCPTCGRIATWFNDVPLRAFCWGTDDKQHAEMTCIVSPPHNPYIPRLAIFGEKWPKAAFQWKTEKQFKTLKIKMGL